MLEVDDSSDDEEVPLELLQKTLQKVAGKKPNVAEKKPQSKAMADNSSDYDDEDVDESEDEPLAFNQ